MQHSTKSKQRTVQLDLKGLEELRLKQCKQICTQKQNLVARGHASLGGRTSSTKLSGCSYITEQAVAPPSQAAGVAAGY